MNKKKKSLANIIKRIGDGDEKESANALVQGFQYLLENHPEEIYGIMEKQEKDSKDD
jgi:hypothetical protein